jgi:fructose-bisphosphate aldolase class I
MFKLTLPDVDDLYKALVAHPNVARVVALSGGYSRAEAVFKLSLQHGIIASFSRGELGSESFDLFLLAWRSH